MNMTKHQSLLMNVSVSAGAALYQCPLDYKGYKQNPHGTIQTFAQKCAFMVQLNIVQTLLLAIFKQALL